MELQCTSIITSCLLTLLLYNRFSFLWLLHKDVICDSMDCHGITWNKIFQSKLMKSGGNTASTVSSKRWFSPQIIQKLTQRYQSNLGNKCNRRLIGSIEETNDILKIYSHFIFYVFKYVNSSYQFWGQVADARQRHHLCSGQEQPNY